VAFERESGSPALVVKHAAGETTLRPRLVVGADGEHSATRSWIGGSITQDPVHHHLGGALIRGLGLQTDRIHQAFFEGGFAFVSPQAHDVARVYLVCASDDAMKIQTSPHPAALIVERFRQSVPEGFLGEAWENIGPVGFFPNATSTLAIPPQRDVVLIGDAAGRNDPSQGHGLSLVFHDVRILGDMLADNSGWDEIPEQFQTIRAGYFETLRQHAHWNERQATETGTDIDELRDRIARAREVDPTAGGFAAIFAIGPDPLEATESARRHFLGEDLVDAPAS
jgi:2-polyprenyl-6-methoxyphenol hydroxylase-like FAD-dependent oxidoreductase